MKGKSAENLLVKLFPLVADGLDEIGAMQQFLDVTTTLGLDTTAILNARFDARASRRTLLKGVAAASAALAHPQRAQSLWSADGRPVERAEAPLDVEARHAWRLLGFDTTVAMTTPERVRRELPYLRIPIYQGLATFSAARCEQLVQSIEQSNWTNAYERNELLAAVNIEWAHATPPDQPEEVIAHANTAGQLLNEGVPGPIRRKWDTSLYLLGGMTRRILLDALKLDTSSVNREIYESFIKV